MEILSFELYDLKVTESLCVFLSTGRDPWEDLTYSLRGSSSLGDRNHHRGEQSHDTAHHCCLILSLHSHSSEWNLSMDQTVFNLVLKPTGKVQFMISVAKKEKVFKTPRAAQSARPVPLQPLPPAAESCVDVSLHS